MASKRLGADAQIRRISSTEIFRHLSNSGNCEKKNHLIGLSTAEFCRGFNGALGFPLA